jgi:transcriptional regulator with XRE-family HTH domain
MRLNIRDLHIHYLAWRLPISGPQGWSLAAAKSPCGSWEVSPSVDVAKKIADALEVSLDYLAGGSDKAAFDKQTLKLIDEIEELEPSVKDKLIFLANAIIRDAKTGKAYAH